MDGEVSLCAYSVFLLLCVYAWPSVSIAPSPRPTHTLADSINISLAYPKLSN